MNQLPDVFTIEWLKISAMNQSCLMAHFIAQNPDVPVEEIEFVQTNTFKEVVFSVRRKKN